MKRTFGKGFSALSVALLTITSHWAAAAPPIQVTAADPSSTTQGTISLDVTVDGNGFDSSASVDFLVTGTTNPGGITVRRVNVIGSKKLIATVDVADTALVANFDIQVTQSGGRKGKGTSLFAVQAKISDPCAALNLDFPAFIYRGSSSPEMRTYVADSTGKCSRLLYTGTTFSAKFSYPIAGTSDIGRVIWREGSDFVYGVTMQVNGTNIAVSSRELIYANTDSRYGILKVELSRDGSTAYASLAGISNADPSKIIAIDIAAGTASNRFVGPIDRSAYTDLAIDADGTLFVDRNVAITDPDDPNQLLRLEPSCMDLSCAAVLAESPSGSHGPNFPAPNLDDSRLVYSQPLAGFINCWLLQVIPDTGGPIINSAQPRYGSSSTWVGGKILTNGIKSPTRKGHCDGTGMITLIDPDTSAETQLFKGSEPDGR